MLFNILRFKMSKHLVFLKRFNDKFITIQLIQLDNIDILL